MQSWQDLFLSSFQRVFKDYREEWADTVAAFRSLFYSHILRKLQVLKKIEKAPYLK